MIFAVKYKKLKLKYKQNLHHRNIEILHVFISLVY